jgi:YfiH family protein
VPETFSALSPPSDALAREPTSTPTPVVSEGHCCWRGTLGAARYAFYGKAAPVASDAALATDADVEAALERRGIQLARMRQVHSARVLEVGAAVVANDGDAMVTRATALALRVVTADCVPVLLASPDAIAAVHAGWRGLAAGILTAAVRALDSNGRPVPIRAIVGPAIGVCCYEVGPEVAEQVAHRAGSDTVIAARGEGRRPHLDLALAARFELGAAGVGEIVTVAACTRCAVDRLWSYRRDGKRAGRNVALIWRDRESA